MANEAAEEISYVPDYIKMEPGTKYGYYWRQIL
jgi:hypothetical protein